MVGQINLKIEDEFDYCGDMKPNVLIVDDNPANIDALEIILDKQDMNLLRATRGKEALEIAANNDIAVIILDVDMPEMDGYEVAKSITSSTDTKHIPIIFLTAHYTSDFSEMEGYNSGAIDYVIKPAKNQILISKINLFCDLFKKNQELKEARKKADEANESKSDFLACMTHELRTPLNGIIGMLELLEFSGDLSELSKKKVESAHLCSNELALLVNDILDFSKLNSGLLPLENIDFPIMAIIQNVYDVLSYVADKNNVELVLDMNLKDVDVIKGDPHRLRQILTNLTGNAIKFSKNGNVTIRVEVENEYDNKVDILFSVKDTGIGIPEDRLDSIFESFTQAFLSTARKYGGTGLGLSISKSLTELMKGEIGVESKVGEGSNFWFRIPFEKCDAVINSQKSINNKVIKKVLVIDSYDATRQMFEHFILDANRECVAVENSQKALDTLVSASNNDENFDLVLMSEFPVGMDSDELCAAIKAHNDIKNVKIILFSTGSEYVNKSYYKKKGFDDAFMVDKYSGRMREAINKILG